MNIMARVKLNIPENKVFSTEIAVRITDINYGNHLGNDAMVSLLHEARMEWLASLQYTELNIEEDALIMADLSVEYKAESFYGDILLIDIFIGELTRVSFEIYYKITTLRNEVDILIANAKTGMVCYDYATKKVVNIPENFLKKLK